MTTEKKINIPQKGAGKKWAKRLKELGSQEIPQEVIERLKNAYKKKSAISATEKDLDL